GGGGDDAGGRRAQRAAGAEAGKGIDEDGRRRIDPDQAGDGRAVGAADPDTDRMAAVEADGPGVAVAVGGAGLEGDAAGGNLRRAGRAGEDGGDVPGGA